jgi:hypothetical protein
MAENDGTDIINEMLARMGKVLNEVSAVASGAGDAGTVVVKEADSKLKELQDQIKILQEGGPQGEKTFEPGQAPADPKYTGDRHPLQILGIRSFHSDQPEADPRNPERIANEYRNLGGPISGGNLVLIMGSGFIREQTQIFFGNVPVAQPIIDPEGKSIRCFAPGAAIEDGNPVSPVNIIIRYIAAEGRPANPQTYPKPYYYHPDGGADEFDRARPGQDPRFAIGEVKPMVGEELKGPIEGGTRLKVTGIGLITGRINVMIGIIPVPNIGEIIEEANGQASFEFNTPRIGEAGKYTIYIIREQGSDASQPKQVLNGGDFEYTAEDEVDDEIKQQIKTLLDEGKEKFTNIREEENIRLKLDQRSRLVTGARENYQEDTAIIKTHINNLKQHEEKFSRTFFHEKDGFLFHHKRGLNVNEAHQNTDTSYLNAASDKIGELIGEYQNIRKFVSAEKQYDNIITEYDQGLVQIAQQIEPIIREMISKIHRFKTKVTRNSKHIEVLSAEFFALISEESTETETILKNIKITEREFIIATYRKVFSRHKKELNSIKTETGLLTDFGQKITDLHADIESFNESPNESQVDKKRRTEKSRKIKMDLNSIKNDFDLLIKAIKKVPALFDKIIEALETFETGAIPAQVVLFQDLKEKAEHAITVIEDALESIESTDTPPAT